MQFTQNNSILTLQCKSNTLRIIIKQNISICYSYIQNHRAQQRMRVSQVLLVLAIAFTVIGAQIEVDPNNPALKEKSRIYCYMISYHFLDNDMNGFDKIVANFTQQKKQYFKNRISHELAENCQQKITVKQVQELSRLIQNSNGHIQEIQLLQDRYIQYFAPEEGVIIRIYEQIKDEFDQKVTEELQKVHYARRQVEEESKKFAQNFKQIEKQILQSHHHINITMNNLKHALQKVQEEVSHAFHKIKSDLGIKKIVDFFQDL